MPQTKKLPQSEEQFKNGPKPVNTVTDVRRPRPLLRLLKAGPKDDDLADDDEDD